MPVTHRELVQIAARYLSDECNCKPVLTEPAGCEECPDAIGFRGGGSIVVECKVSEADFFADAAKPFRVEPATGMGRLRYYLCEPGVIEPFRVEEIGWGLLHYADGNVTVVEEAPEFHRRAWWSEIKILCGAVSNYQIETAKTPSQVRKSGARKPANELITLVEAHYANHPEDSAKVIRWALETQHVNLSGGKRETLKQIENVLTQLRAKQARTVAV